MNYRLRTKKGFTLIEILAAIAVVGLGIIPVMNTLPEGLKALRKTEHLTRDVMLAQQKMDELRDQILGTNASYGYSKSGGYGGSGTFTGFSGYRYSVTDDQGSDIRELTVDVWFDDNGNGTLDTGEDSVTLDTKIAKR
ncbi:MAG: type II secretion system protein [Candidatus Omnitrophota bacterium]